MKRTDWILLLAVGLASSAWCLTSARQLGATFDEPFYLEAGLDFWRRGTSAQLLAAGTMPLSAHLQTLPLYIVERTTDHPWRIAEDIGRMLPMARSLTLVFWWLLLAYALRLGHAVGGSWGGRAALMLGGADPNFLAHASLATTDIALAACTTGFAYHLWTGRDREWGWRVGVPAVWLALAITAKVSALTFGGLALIAWAVAAARMRGVRASVTDSLWMGGLALALAVVYCGPGGGPSFQGTLSRMPAEHFLRPLVAWIGALPLFPNALYAIWFQVDHNQSGQSAYVIGRESTSWMWFYLPVLLSIKLPAATLGMIAAVLVARRARARTAVALAGVTALLMLVVRVQTGIRFLLPAIVWLLVWLAAEGVRLIQHLPAARRRFAIACATSALGWTIVNAGQAWPDGLRFTNELWGGTARGHLVVSDSNYDWGQGLPELAEWGRHHPRPLAVWYFGTDPRFPELARYDPRREGLDAPVLRGRDLAVSTSLLYGGYLTTPGPGRSIMLHLRRQTPIGRTRTFLIFEAPDYAAGGKDPLP